MTPLSHALSAPPLEATADSEVDPEASPKAWLTQSLVLAGRQLVVYFRDVPTLLQALIVPALTLVMFKVVLGDSLGAVTGQDSIYGTVPMVILVGAMFGSIASAVRLNQERSTGLLARLYVLPINRAADLTSRVIAELVRIFVVTIVLLGIGALMGFRFQQGVGGAVGILVVAMLYGAAFATLVLALAVNAAPAAPLVPMIGLVSSLMMFFNSGFSPVDAYPDWLQPIVRYQPMTPAVDLMRSLAVGGPLTRDAALVAIWTVAVLAVSIYPALRGYSKAATAH